MSANKIRSLVYISTMKKHERVKGWLGDGNMGQGPFSSGDQRKPLSIQHLRKDLTKGVGGSQLNLGKSHSRQRSQKAPRCCPYMFQEPQKRQCNQKEVTRDL